MNNKMLAALALIPILSGSTCSRANDNRPLTREVFVAAIAKCKPLDASFVTNADGPPSITITIPPGPSEVPNCVAKEIDGFAVKVLTIKYDRSGNA